MVSGRKQLKYMYTNLAKQMIIVQQEDTAVE